LTAVLLFLVVVLSAILSDPRRFDFVTFYTGGLIIRQGNGSRLYDLGEQARIERHVLDRGTLLINPHPPFEALWFSVLARLPYLKAYLLWGAINAIIWLLFQQVLRPHAPLPRHPYRYFLLCSMLFPLWVALIRGQTSVLALLLFSLTFVCLKRGQDFRAGMFLGLGLFKFAVVLPFALICFLRNRWRMMTGFAAGASLLGVLSVMAVGLAGMRSYANLLMNVMRNPDDPAYVNSFDIWGMPTVRGFFTSLLTGHLSTVHIRVTVAAASASLLLFAAWRWRQEDRRRDGNPSGLMFAAALAVSLVTAPHLYMHDLTLMLLAVLLVIGSPQWPGKSRYRAALTVAIVILYLPPVYFLLQRWKAMYLLAPLLVAFALAAISLARKNSLTVEVAQGQSHLGLLPNWPRATRDK
jgi:hypothetical protein